MKKSFSFFICAVCFLAGFPLDACSQDRDVDEMRLEIGETGIAELEQKPVVPEKLLVDKEEKYVAGKDKLWFTDDDALYHYYMIEHDADGKVYKKYCYKPGKDRIPYTYDDELQDFQVFEYGFDGKLVKETSYEGQSKKQYELQSTTVYEYDGQGRKVRRICSYPGKKEKRIVVYSYDEDGQQVKGVESFGDNIEKYHHFEYDDFGKMTRVVEYHFEHNGKGPDGVWFTPDDVVSSAKETLYDADGTKSQDNKYIAPGDDGLWFTADDLMQYYVLFEFQE